MLYIYTGEGKGKTTAALGLIMRAYGTGKSCAIVFFDKNSDYCSEIGTLRELGIKSYIFGANRVMADTFRFENIEEDFKEASNAVNAACEILKDGSTDVLTLDEVLNAIRVGLIPLGEILNFIDQWPREKYLVLTGRGLPPEIKERADLVSDIIAVKHPFLDKNFIAQRGIDY
jgi:cob(I)alamin adenosyltransferase